MTALPHPPEPAASHRAIENLIARYAELVDDGDFAGLGVLLSGATLFANGDPVSGADAIERLSYDLMILYPDGTPRTQHVTTNIFIEIDEGANTAVSRSYVTVMQSLPDLPLQAIAAGRYQDRFERRDGQWQFAERRLRITHVGDVSRHIRPTAAK